MKKYIKLFLTFAISVTFAACSNDDNVDDSGIGQGQSSKDIILRERDPNLPNVVTLDISSGETPKTKAAYPEQGIIGKSDELLGFSYTIGNSIIGDFNNVKFRVVDVNKAKAIDKDYVMPKQLFGNTIRSVSYANFDRYEYNSSVTKKVTSGFKLNLKVFSFGRKKTTTETFTEQIIKSNNSVYGELDLNIRNSSFALQTVEGALKLYARQCLADSYMKHLYQSTIGSILNNYGDFVLTGYVTGGRAFAFYAGDAGEKFEMTKKEKDMKKDIDASFSWKSNSASGSLGFGKNNGNSTNTNYSTKNIEILVKTYGGQSSGQAIVSAVPLDNLSLDLSYWLNSVADVNKHTIIDVLDEGLTPMSYFVLEENFKKRFDDSFAGVLEKRTKLINPYIEIIRVYVRSSASGEPLYEIAPVLNTRQGDKIVLSDGTAITASDAALKANESDAVFMQKVQEILNKKGVYYAGLQFRYNKGIKLIPSIRTTLVIRLNGVNEPTMFKYRNPITGMEYIYDTSKRIAFSHLTDKINEDWILDLYGMRDWVESLPVKSISMATLANSYKIIGL